MIFNYHFAYTAWPTVEFDADPAEVVEDDPADEGLLPICRHTEHDQRVVEHADDHGAEHGAKATRPAAERRHDRGRSRPARESLAETAYL